MKKLFILAFMAVLATLFTTTLSSCNRHTRSNEKCVIENADSIAIADIAVSAVVNPVFTNQDDVVRFVQDRKDLAEFDELIHHLSYECIRTIASVISSKHSRFTIGAFMDEYRSNQRIYDAMNVNDSPDSSNRSYSTDQIRSKYDTIPMTVYRKIDNKIVEERRNI